MEVASTGDRIQLTADGLSKRLLVVLTTVGLVVGAVGWAYAQNGAPRDELRAERRAVATRAEDFAVTFNTYSIKDKADYQRRVKRLMTPEFFKEHKRVTDAIFKVIEDKNQSSGNVKVLSVAVDSIDQDSATAILAINWTVRRGGEKPVLDRSRWSVSMSKVDDQWLVRRAGPVDAMDATLGDVTDKTGEKK